ncbi:MAG: S8 family peptidase, partial [Candidatus Thermoplasmatota archaeon]
YITNYVLKEAMDNLYNLEEINIRVNEEFNSYAHGYYNPRVFEDYNVEINNWELYITLEKEKIKGFTPTGEVLDGTKVAYPCIVGVVEYNIRDNDKVDIKRSFKLKRELSSPYPLLINLFDSLEANSRNDDSGIEKTVSSILFTLGNLRLANGERDAYKIITPQDVKLSINLALLIEELRIFRNYDVGAEKDFEIKPNLQKWAVNERLNPSDIYFILNCYKFKLSNLVLEYLKSLKDPSIKYLDDIIGDSEKLIIEDVKSIKLSGHDVDWLDYIHGKPWTNKLEEIKGIYEPTIDEIIDDYYVKNSKEIEITPEPSDEQSITDQLVNSANGNLDREMQLIGDKIKSIEKENKINKNVKIHIEEAIESIKDYIDIESIDRNEKKPSWVPPYLFDTYTVYIRKDTNEEVPFDKCEVKDDGSIVYIDENGVEIPCRVEERNRYSDREIIDEANGLLKKAINDNMDLISEPVADGTTKSIYSLLFDIMESTKEHVSSHLYKIKKTEQQNNFNYIIKQMFGKPFEILGNEDWIDIDHEPNIIEPDIEISIFGSKWKLSDNWLKTPLYKTEYRISIDSEYDVSIRGNLKNIPTSGTYLPTKISSIDGMWSIPINIEFSVPLYSGWELDSIGYNTRDFLVNDEANAYTQIENKLEDISGTLTKLSYTLKQTMNDYGGKFPLIDEKELSIIFYDIVSTNKLTPINMQTKASEILKEIEKLPEKDFSSDFYGSELSICNSESQVEILRTKDNELWKLIIEKKPTPKISIQGSMSFDKYRFALTFEPNIETNVWHGTITGERRVNERGWTIKIELPYFFETKKTYSLVFGDFDLGFISDADDETFYSILSDSKTLFTKKNSGAGVEEVKKFAKFLLYRAKDKIANTDANELTFFIKNDLLTLKFKIKEPKSAFNPISDWLIENVDEIIKNMGKRKWSISLLDFPEQHIDNLFVQLEETFISPNTKFQVQYDIPSIAKQWGMNLGSWDIDIGLQGIFKAELHELWNQVTNIPLPLPKNIPVETEQEEEKLEIPAHKPNELLVKFKNELESETIDKLKEKFGAMNIEKVFGNWYKIKFLEKDNVDLTAKLSEIGNEPDVDDADLNYEVVLYGMPNDEYFKHQWSLNNEGQEYYGVEKISGDNNDKQILKKGRIDADIDVSEAWNNLGKPNTEITVAVIDTGIDYNHEDIKDNIWKNKDEIPGNGIDDDKNGYIDDYMGWDFGNYDNDPIDKHGHGTHVAGIIGAIIDNSLGVSGVVPANIKLMPVKIFSDSGWGFGDAASAIKYAADSGARILSNSWGFISPGFYPGIVKEAVQYATDKGCVVIFAAGNGYSGKRYYPGADENVVGVGATDSIDSKASFSNYGNWVDVSAPGVDILSLRAENTDMYAPSEPNVHIVPQTKDAQGRYVGKYYLADGTSMAAPHVSGVAALILLKHPEFTNKEVRAILKSTGDIPNSNQYIGTGRINAYKALTVDSIPISEIHYPVGDDIVSGEIEIIGTANGRNGIKMYKI